MRPSYKSSNLIVPLRLVCLPCLAVGLLLEPSSYRGVGRTPLWRSTHYVTHAQSTGAGFGNRVQALQISLAIAIATNRTLLVQSFSPYHKLQRNGTPTHDGPEHVPYTTYLEPITGWPVVAIDDVDVSSLTTEKLDLRPTGCDRTMQSIVDKFGGSAADILEFDSFYGYWEAMFSADDHPLLFNIFRDHIRFRSGIVEAARMLQESLPKPYGAIHVRLGDRGGTALLNCSENGDKWSDEKFGCIENSMEHRLEVEPINGLGLKHVYVATDAPDAERTHGIEDGIKSHGMTVSTWDGFAKDLQRKALAMSDYGGDSQTRLAAMTAASAYEGEDSRATARYDRAGTLISLLETLVAINADVFVPSFPSSWDSLAIFMRMTAGSAAASKQFAVMVQTVKLFHCDPLHPRRRGKRR